MKLLYVGISLFLVCFTGMAKQPNIVFLFRMIMRPRRLVPMGMSWRRWHQRRI